MSLVHGQRLPPALHALLRGDVPEPAPAAAGAGRALGGVSDAVPPGREPFVAAALARAGA